MSERAVGVEGRTETAPGLLRCFVRWLERGSRGSDHLATYSVGSVQDHLGAARTSARIAIQGDESTSPV